jgi:hypothetical protein
MENWLLVLMFVNDVDTNINNAMLKLMKSKHSQKLKGGYGISYWKA